MTVWSDACTVSTVKARTTWWSLKKLETSISTASNLVISPKRSSNNVFSKTNAVCASSDNKSYDANASKTMLLWIASMVFTV